MRLIERMLAPAEPDFEPDSIHRRTGKGGFRVGCLLGVQTEPGQSLIEEALLAGA
ncbi:hypothetical protein AA105894_0646 [Asaia spathodeae NBRC 105894]|nr:hypothetical protein AA105894_0646 [Asaia spathodeae NBRC 105894]